MGRMFKSSNKETERKGRKFNRKRGIDRGGTGHVRGESSLVSLKWGNESELSTEGSMNQIVVLLYLTPISPPHP